MRPYLFLLLFCVCIFDTEAQEAPDSDIISCIDGDCFDEESLARYRSDSYYNGEFQGGMRNGKGNYSCDKYIYEGEWICDEFSGNGKLEFKSDNTKYVGEFKYGLPTSNCAYFYEDNYYYVGEYDGWEITGQGKSYINGALFYVGGFKNGEFEGEGLLNFTNYDIVYEGEFKDGKMHGFGTLNCTDERRHFDKYEGEVADGFVTGVGTMYYTDGGIYMGDFYKGVKEGFGVSFNATGDIYRGFYKEDAYHGFGEYYFHNIDLNQISLFLLADYDHDINRGMGAFYNVDNSFTIVDFKDGEQGRSVFFDSYETDHIFDLETTVIERIEFFENSEHPEHFDIFIEEGLSLKDRLFSFNSSITHGYFVVTDVEQYYETELNEQLIKQGYSADVLDKDNADYLELRTEIFNLPGTMGDLVYVHAEDPETGEILFDAIGVNMSAEKFRKRLFSEIF